MASSAASVNVGKCTFCNQSFTSPEPGDAEDSFLRTRLYELIHSSGVEYRHHFAHKRCYDNISHINPFAPCPIDGAPIRENHMSLWAVAERMIDFGNEEDRQKGLQLKRQLFFNTCSDSINSVPPASLATLGNIRRECNFCEEDWLSELPEIPKTVVEIPFQATAERVNYFVHEKCVAQAMKTLDPTKIGAPWQIPFWTLAERASDFGDEQTRKWGLYCKGEIRSSQPSWFEAGSRSVLNYYPDAALYFERAGDFSEAQIALGDCYQQGTDGVSEDFEKALQCYLGALRQGDWKGLLKIKEAASEESEKDTSTVFRKAYIDCYYQKLGPVSFLDIIKYCEELTQKGDREIFPKFKKQVKKDQNPKAMICLGDYYEQAGAHQKLEEAVRWFLAAAKEGNSRSITRLQNIVETTGNGFALEALGDCYLNGWGSLLKDEETARLYYCKAAKKGRSSSIQWLVHDATHASQSALLDIAQNLNLIELYRQILKTTKSNLSLKLIHQQTLDQLKKMAKDGNLAAIKCLGDYYSENHDDTNAVKYYGQAANLGDESALGRLEAIIRETHLSDDLVNYIANCFFLSAVQDGNVISLSRLKNLADNGNVIARQKVEEYEKRVHEELNRNPGKRSLGDSLDLEAPQDSNKRFHS